CNIFGESVKALDQARLLELKVRVAISYAEYPPLNVQFLEQLYLSALFRKWIGLIIANDIAVLVKFEGVGIDVFGLDAIRRHHWCNELFEASIYNPCRVAIIDKEIAIAIKGFQNVLHQMWDEQLEVCVIGGQDREWSR